MTREWGHQQWVFNVRQIEHNFVISINVIRGMIGKTSLWLRGVERGYANVMREHQLISQSAEDTS